MQLYSGVPKREYIKPSVINRTLKADKKDRMFLKLIVNSVGLLKPGKLGQYSSEYSGSKRKRVRVKKIALKGRVPSTRRVLK